MRSARWLVAGGLGLLSQNALAQCEGDWDVARINSELDTADTAFETADLTTIKDLIKDVDRGFPCLDDYADKALIGRYARVQGLLAFYEQDETGARRWGVLGRVVDPDGKWPVELPDTHPYLELMAEAEDPPLVDSNGGFIVDEGEGIFYNGTFLREPQARADIPGLVQLFDTNGHPKDAFWQEGAVFSEALLDSQAGPVPYPRWYDPDTGEIDPARKAAKVKIEKIKPEREPIDIPWVPLGISGGLAATGGLTYALAGSAQSSMASAEEAQQLTRARSTANALVLVSGLAFVGAAGVGIGGVMLDGRTVGWSVRF